MNSFIHSLKLWFCILNRYYHIWVIPWYNCLVTKKMKVQQDMKTSIIGYPRIGSLRELKFASEKYFRSEIPSEELLETAKEIRLNNRNIQKANGIDLIPSNDFSLYFLPTVKYYIRISLATHFYVVFKRYLCVIYFLSNYRLPLVPFGVFNIRGLPRYI